MRVTLSLTDLVLGSRALPILHVEGITEASFVAYLRDDINPYMKKVRREPDTRLFNTTNKESDNSPETFCSKLGPTFRLLNGYIDQSQIQASTPSGNITLTNP